MELLERDEVLADLHAALGRAAEESGRLVFISGEAGVGKTSLLARFVDTVGEHARVLWGGCEPLHTPRPLGPLHDMLPELGGVVQEMLRRGVGTDALFPALLTDLRREERPTVLLFEDVHWADEATLDLLRYLGRRLAQIPGPLLVATFRGDEVGADHPLRLVLGDLATTRPQRVRLPTLSPVAVARLASSTRGRWSTSPEELHRITGGNPFFVTEVLASADRRVPATVRDAVLARAGRLGEDARHLLEDAAQVPGRLELTLLEAVAGGDLSGLDECVASGVLRREGGRISFRHELARRVCEEAASPERRLGVHRRILTHLLEHDAAPSRLVHHAAAAGDTAVLRRFVPAAVREASTVGAHREAAAHYRLSLEHDEGLADAERAGLLDGLSYECYLTHQIEEALDSRRRAVALWERLADDLRSGDGLRWMSRLSWFLGRKADADRYARAAVHRLEPLGEIRQLAMAYSNRAQLHMLAWERDEAVSWGERAIAIARRLEDAETLCHALNNVGTARAVFGELEGREVLQESLRIALDHRFHEHVARAYTNLGSTAVGQRLYPDAVAELESGIEYTTARDLDSWRFYMLGWRARAHLEQGRWREAGNDAQIVLGQPGSPPITRITALVVHGSLLARRGHPDAREVLEEARALAEPTGELQRVAPVVLAQAELAWLEGRASDLLGDLEKLDASARATGPSWLAGELAAAVERAGGRAEAPAGCAEPCALQLAGDWRAAARAWERLGCPWERALALCAADDEDALLDALETFQRLGARPAAQICRRALRRLGARSIPRGPYRARRANPAGLTARQLEVLSHLADGSTNREIAERLHISLKTVEHHVSAILERLDAPSRAEAVAAAERLGLLDADP